MATDIKQYISLRSIVGHFLNEEDKSAASSDRAWLLGLRALTDAHYDIAAEPITVELPVQSNKTAAFPPDCLMWNKVGLRAANGELAVLRINRALTTFRDNMPTRLSDITSQVNDIDTDTPVTPFFNYYNNGACYQLFGLGGGLITFGDCKIDDVNRVIIFPPDFSHSSVLFEYMPAPERGVDYQVPTILQEAIIAFIKWKMKLGHRDEYYGALTSARRRMPNKKFVLQSFQQTIRESESMKLRS